MQIYLLRRQAQTLMHSVVGPVLRILLQSDGPADCFPSRWPKSLALYRRMTMRPTVRALEPQTLRDVWYVHPGSYRSSGHLDLSRLGRSRSTVETQKAR